MPARDLYMYDITDPNYQSGILEVSDEIAILISQIRMILSTPPGSVLGAPDFGIDLESQLFVFNINEYSLRSMLLDQVNKFVPLAEKYQIKFNISFAKGVSMDICLIDTLINGTPMFGVLI